MLDEMAGYRELMRRKLMEQVYERLTPEEKQMFVQMTMQDKGHEEILQALQSQQAQLEEIKKSQSWWLDLSSNVAGNAIFDGAVWLLSKLVRRL